jgi:hypothetical protein
VKTATSAEFTAREFKPGSTAARQPASDARGKSAEPDGSKLSSRSLSALDHLVEFFSSLRLTVVLLCLAVVLVFIGTLAQTSEGLWVAQNRYFRSPLIWWSPAGAKWGIPVFPGGYLIGGMLLLNLLAAHAKRFKFTKKKIGIFVIHAGIVLLILGQFGTDLLSTESAMRLYEGQSSNFSEAFRENELVIADTSDPQLDTVYSIPDSKLVKGHEIRDPRLPFAVRVNDQWANAELSATATEGALNSGATSGALKDAFVLPRPRVTDTESRNWPAATVELLDNHGVEGTFLVWARAIPQHFHANGKSYEITLRSKRFYYPFSVTLLKPTHEVYKGTDIPKNFASRVRVENPSRSEARETVISMNNPLRYAGLTFFQYQMTAGELAAKEGVRPSSVFQVVHNPSWLTPYVSCIMVAAGLIIQFMSHLIGFVMKRRTA